MKEQTTAVPDEYVLRHVSVENSNLEIAFLMTGILFFVVATALIIRSLWDFKGIR